MRSERYVRVTVVMPSYSTRPIGGFRVHYEYANRLAARGHAVTVVGLVRSRRVRLGLRRRGLRRVSSWFDFDNRVGLKISDGRTIGPCDVAIVTAWQTAEIVPTIRPLVRGVVQIAYDYEYWMTADVATRERMARAFTYPDFVLATFSMPSRPC